MHHRDLFFIFFALVSMTVLLYYNIAEAHFASQNILLLKNTFAQKNSLLQIGLLQFAL